MVITVYSDISFYLSLRPAVVIIKKYCKIKSGSGVPNKTKVATISQKIDETKIPDLNAASLKAVMY